MYAAGSSWIPDLNLLMGKCSQLSLDLNAQACESWVCSVLAFFCAGTSCSSFYPQKTGVFSTLLIFNMILLSPKPPCSKLHLGHRHPYRNPWSNWHLQKQSSAGDNRVMRFLTSPEVDDRVLPQEIPSDRKTMMLALRGFLSASTIKKNWRRILAPTVLYFSPAAGQNHDCILKGDLVKGNSQNDMIHSGKGDIWKKSLTLLKSSDPFGQTLGCLLELYDVSNRSITLDGSSVLPPSGSAYQGFLACSVLQHCIQKRHSVDYGIRRSFGKRLAVPYRASNTPSDRSEFGHPDCAIASRSKRWLLTDILPRGITAGHGWNWCFLPHGSSCRISLDRGSCNDKWSLWANLSEAPCSLVKHAGTNHLGHTLGNHLLLLSSRILLIIIAYSVWRLG